ncbi:hypothetical protein [Thiobacillus denitrificans]|uniref:hypothetical protein n=1 Tax=Thiobacillus denitrificans TaxID=36861 RepID=UPI00037A2B70|nr:hypothetical protein [Thiobacillus denitrificans]
MNTMTKSLVDEGLVLKCPGCGECSSVSREYIDAKDSPMSSQYEKGEIAPIRHASEEGWECGHCHALNLQDLWYEPVIAKGHMLTLRH